MGYLKVEELLDAKWIFKNKFGLLSIEDTKYKTRLVDKGYNQKKGVDYNEILSLFIRHMSIRILLPLVATMDM